MSKQPRQQAGESAGISEEAERLPDVLGGGQIMVDLSRAEIDMQIATAHRYKRSIEDVIVMISTMALRGPEAAENCMYALPRDGKAIIGPSIGFANIAASAWGNCIDGHRWVATDRREKVVVAEGIFHDLQTNRKVLVGETRRISSKSGRIYSDDMIVTTAKAAGAIARRNAILQVIPRAIWHPIFDEAVGIVRGDVRTFAETKDKALAAMHQFGVKPEQVFLALGLKGEADLTFEHVPVIRAMYATLRDGAMTVEEMFDPRRMTGTAFEQVEDPLSDEEPGDETGPRTAAQRAAGGTTQAAPTQHPDEGAAGSADNAQRTPAGSPAAAGAAADRLEPEDAPTTTTGAQKETPADLAPPAARPKAARTARATAKAAEQRAASEPAAKAPETEDEYAAYARAKFAAGASPSALNDWYKSQGERNIRNALKKPLTEATRNALLADLAARVAELAAAQGTAGRSQ